MSENLHSKISEAFRLYRLKKGIKSSIKPKAVLFDMDGVLYDSMTFHAKAWYETAISHNLKCTPELFYLYEGRTGDSTINELYTATFGREATEEEKQSIYKEKANLFNKYNDGHEMPGANHVLATVKAAGLERVLVTGSGQITLIDKLEHSYPGSFSKDKMVTAFDVKYGKPHPEPYLMGLQKASARPEEAIVVENAPLGVEAAVAADIFTVAVNTGPLPDNVLTDAGANILFDSMDDLAKAMPTIIAAWKEA